MIAAWRRDKPTLRSERAEGEKDTFLVRWQFGLAGIAAEAEDQYWAKRLTSAEAELACRYAPIELNGSRPGSRVWPSSIPPPSTASSGKNSVIRSAR